MVWILAQMIIHSRAAQPISEMTRELERYLFNKLTQVMRILHFLARISAYIALTKFPKFFEKQNKTIKQKEADNISTLI